MKCFNFFTGILCLLFIVFNSQNSWAQIPGGKAVDVVLCVDLSGSTTGMTERLKENIFDIANSVSAVKPSPDLRIAFVAYARPSFLGANSYVKVYSDFTRQVDSLEITLGKIIPYVEKGDQLVGAAINTCIENLNWSKEKNASKIICLIGNGLVTLGPVPYVTACESAKKKKIIINTIYSMTPTYSRDIGGWKTIAEITGGEQFEFDLPKRQNPDVQQNLKEIEDLNQRFNNSLIYYNEDGQVALNRIQKLDNDLPSFNLRAYQGWLKYKSGDAFQYEINKWELVSYANTAGFDIMQIDRNALPEKYQDNTGADMVKIFKSNLSERQQVCLAMQKKLSVSVNYNNEDVRKKAEQDDDNLFGKTVIQAILKSLSKQGFSAPNFTTGFIQK